MTYEKKKDNRNTKDTRSQANKGWLENLREFKKKRKEFIWHEMPSRKFIII